MKRQALKRQLYAWLLLAVFLPVLALSSVHVHRHADAPVAECTDCLNHSCQGHLTVTDDPLHQCVLCQFLTLSYIAAATIAVILFAQQDIHMFTCCSTSAYMRHSSLTCPTRICFELKGDNLILFI